MGSQDPNNSLNVIVVDDEPDTVMTLAAILRDAGHSVTEATNAFHVLGLVTRHKPDAVILDIDMPGMSGYSVARELRNVFEEDVPLLICISGKWIGQTDRMLADMAGFNHFCQKPCDPEILLRHLAPLAAVKKVLYRDTEKTAPPTGGD